MDGEEPLNPQESIREKTHIVTIPLPEWVFIYQENFEINVLVSIVFNISRERNLTNESQIHDTLKNIFQEDTLRPLHRNWDSAYFWRSHDRFWKNNYLIAENFRHLVKISTHFVTENFCLYMAKGNIWKKATSKTKPREFSRIFVIYKIPKNLI